MKSATDFVVSVAAETSSGLRYLSFIPGEEDPLGTGTDVFCGLGTGSNYLFDPAFKPHQTTAGIDLKSAMGYTKTAFLTAAGGTVGTDYVQNLNETDLRTA
ncbi:MAG: hypothetical protein V2B19_07785, partial [Pseudomonadota bacterium]